MSFALMEFGRVTRLADERVEVPIGAEWRDLAGLTPVPEVGWCVAADGTLVPPEPTYVLRTLAWRRRLTDAEIGGVTLAASKGLEQGDPTLQVFLDDLGRATAVDVREVHFQSGLQAAVQLGLIAADRIAALTAPAQPDEVP